MSKSYFFQYPQLKVSPVVLSGFSSNAKKLPSFGYILLTITRKSVIFPPIYVYGIRKFYQWLDAKCIQYCLIFTLLYHVPPLDLAKSENNRGVFWTEENSRFTYMDIVRNSFFLVDRDQTCIQKVIRARKNAF